MVTTAVILAPDDNGTETVFGIPAARRLVRLLIRLGVVNIHVVGRVNPYVPILSDLVPRIRFHPVEPGDGPDEVIRELGTADDEKVLVLKANHVADKSTLARFLELGADSFPCSMKVDGARKGNERLFLVYGRDLEPVIRSLWSNTALDPSVLNDAKEAPGLKGLPCVIENRASDAARCEDRLVDALAAQTEADDGPMARYFDRRISQFMSRRLAGTRIMPNQITLIGMTIGLLGALLLSCSGYWPKVIGSFLFVFCIIVDGVDGEVARLALKESTFGHYLDIVTDNFVHAAVFVGIAFGLYHDTGDAGYLRYLWILLGGFCFCAVAVYMFILRLDADTLGRSPRTLRIMALVTNRDFAYLVFALALIGRLNWFLLGAALGTYLFAGVLWYFGTQDRRLRTSEADRPTTA